MLLVNQKFLLFPLLLTSLLFSREEFSIEEMKSYLSEENPYVYSSLAKKSLNEKRLISARGVYDTTITAQYDEKEYPYTEGTYYAAGVKKFTESGIELSGIYRYAEGTQEYNNIKTGKNGEFLVGAKLPIITLLNQMDERRLRVSLTQMDIKNAEFRYKEAMRSLYFTMMSEYYLLLYNKSLVEVTQRLYEKVAKREEYIERSIKEGSLPKIALLEVQQQRIHANQELINASRAFENGFVAFLKYLNLSKEAFHAKYRLPNLPDLQNLVIEYNGTLQEALRNRSDFKIYDTEIEKLMLERKNNQRKEFPNLDVGIYGVKDVNEDSGFKLSLNFNFPVARSEYRGKELEIAQKKSIIESEKEILLRELKADLQKIIYSLDILDKTLINALEERDLLSALEDAERKKYTLGASTLFILNQREIRTMESEKKILQYKLEKQLLFESYKRMTSQHDLGS